ncbi:MAG TPA: hypothetical protein VN783_13770 [Thermoanaerobaculia bacterium]|nr:hypothetical protein [Thermoanaerobaculia bacterium]
MALADPFAAVPKWGMALLLVGGVAIFCWAGRKMKPENAPAGQLPPPSQVSLEFAGTPKGVATLLAAWTEPQKSALRRGISFDFLFILGYAVPLGILVSLLSRHLGRSWPVLGAWGAAIAWAQLVAGGLDVIENVLLLAILRGSLVPVWPPLAFAVAGVKFVLVGLGILWIVVCAAIALALFLGWHSAAA